MTDLKPVFLSPIVKKVIEIHMGLMGFTSRNSALEDMLKESEKFNKLIEMLKIHTPEKSLPMDLKEKSRQENKSEDVCLDNPADDIVGLTEKKVEDLLKDSEFKHKE